MQHNPIIIGTEKRCTPLRKAITKIDMKKIGSEINPELLTSTIHWISRNPTIS